MKTSANPPPAHCGDLPAPLSRRHFLGSTLGAALPLAAALPAGAQQAAPTRDGKPTRKLKTGFVGLGGRGLWIAKLFLEHGGYEAFAVADYFPEVATNAGRELGVEPVRCFSGLSGYQKVIASGIEAIVLEVPPWFFPEMAAAAAEAGLHVFMAKPVAVDVPGTLRVEAAAARATAQKRCFLIDYQIPTDPHILECDRRFRKGASGSLSMVRSSYYGGQFADPPLTPGIESRLRSLVWVNDIAIGGGYHVNACIHPVQAVMWMLDRTPVAAIGISRTTRPDPHGDSHDLFAITYEFADGLLWNHTGRHVDGTVGPEDPLATCEFLGQAYMKIGYGGRALIRGGGISYPGGSIDDLYRAGAVRNIATFHQQVCEGDSSNPTVPMAIASCLATILGREAAARKVRLTMEELVRENKALTLDLTSLKA